MKIKTVEQLVEAELGKKQIRQIKNYAFDFATEEAKLIGIPTKGPIFARMCKFRRNYIFMEIYDFVEEMKKRQPKTKIEIAFPVCDEQVEEIVKSKYGVFK